MSSTEKEPTKDLGVLQHLPETGHTSEEEQDSPTCMTTGVAGPDPGAEEPPTEREPGGGEPDGGEPPAQPQDE